MRPGLRTRSGWGRLVRWRDLVAIGASAAGVQAARAVLATLAAHLPATVLVGPHLPPRALTALPLIPAGRVQDRTDAPSPRASPP
ncbi:MAG TPA: chemotaxis protein CheB [Mycobacteriales bacterium]|nr:chemotaxis protein CheB [Mycobacteriales bacterium]